LVTNIIVEESLKHERTSCEEHIVHCQKPFVIDRKSTESIIHAKDPLWHCENDILVKEIKNQFSISNVIQSAMLENELPKELKLSKSIVTSLHCSHTFMTVKTNSNVSF
jgi:hypothetical protein